MTWQESLTPEALAAIPDDWREQTKGMTEAQALRFMRDEMAGQARHLAEQEAEIERHSRLLEAVKRHVITGEEPMEVLLERTARVGGTTVPDLLASLGFTMDDMQKPLFLGDPEESARRLIEA